MQPAGAPASDEVCDPQVPDVSECPFENRPGSYVSLLAMQSPDYRRRYRIGRVHWFSRPPAP